MQKTRQSQRRESAKDELFRNEKLHSKVSECYLSRESICNNGFTPLHYFSLK